jgi:hypothetical protein
MRQFDATQANLLMVIALYPVGKMYGANVLLDSVSILKQLMVTLNGVKSI